MRKTTYNVHYQGKVLKAEAKNPNGAIRQVIHPVPRHDRNTGLPKDVYVEPENGWKVGKLSMTGRKVR